MKSQADGAAMAPPPPRTPWLRTCRRGRRRHARPGRAPARVVAAAHPLDSGVTADVVAAAHPLAGGVTAPAPYQLDPRVPGKEIEGARMERRSGGWSVCSA